MRVWLKNVTQVRADVVQTLSKPEDVNIWHASGDRAWRLPDPGDLILFRLEGRDRVIIGYGSYVETTLHYAQDAWALFRQANGARTLDDLLAQINDRRIRRGHAMPVIGNAIIAQPSIFPALTPFELPLAFSTNDTRAPLCSTTNRSGKILTTSLQKHLSLSTDLGETAQKGFVDPTTRRLRGTSLRLGRSALRSVLSKLYGHRCAISGARIIVMLDAAHIRALRHGGRDDLGNLIFLEANLHRLFESGLIGIDEQHRVMVSAQLILFGPAPAYLAYAGQPLRRRVFGAPWPDEANLAWHRKHIFEWPTHES